MKIHTCQTLQGARRSWMHLVAVFLCVWSAKTWISPIWAHGCRRYYTGGIWGLGSPLYIYGTNTGHQHFLTATILWTNYFVCTWVGYYTLDYVLVAAHNPILKSRVKTAILATVHSATILWVLWRHTDSFGKSVLQGPDTGTWVLDNTRPLLRSSILNFWMPPAHSKECKYHIFRWYWYTKNVPVLTSTGTFHYLGPEVYLSTVSITTKFGNDPLKPYNHSHVTMSLIGCIN